MFITTHNRDHSDNDGFIIYLSKVTTISNNSIIIMPVNFVI